MARDPFRPSFLGEDPLARETRIRARRDSWRKLVLKRQRILNANGFNVPVDGNWGKRTSSAWWRHNRGLAPVAGRIVPRAPVVGENAADKARTFKIGRAVPPSLGQRAARAARAAVVEAKKQRPVDLRHAAAKALASSPRRPKGVPDRGRTPVPTANELQAVRQDTQRREVVVKAEIEKQAQARFTKAWEKKAAPERWDSRDIVALFADPLTRVKDWHEKPEWVGRLQKWLMAHGHTVGRIGIWDAPTADALKAEMIRRQANYRRWRTTQLVKHIYTPLGIKPGEQGFPILGTAPTPEALLKLADTGGFSAEAVFAELARRMNDLQLQSSFRAYQDEQLDALLRGGDGVPQAASAFGPFLTPLMLSQMTPGQKYAAILLGFASQFNQHPEVGASVENDPGRKGDTFFDEVSALAQANSPEDLQRRIKQVKIADEKLFQFTMAVRASDNNFFFRGGKAVLHALGVPAEFTQDQAAAAFGAIQAFVDPRTRAKADAALRGDLNAAMEVQDAVQRGAATGRALWAQWEKDHPVYGFVVDVLADPLNLVPAAWLGHTWRGTKFGVKAVERAGEAARASTATKPLPLRLVGQGVGGTLKLPASYGVAVRSEVQAMKAAIKQSKVGRLNRAVRESVDDVTRTVRVAFDHGFSPAKQGDAADVAQIKDDLHKMLKGVVATDPITGRKINLLDEIERLGVGTFDDMTNFFGDLVTLASQQRLSLYTHQGRGTLSDFGRAVEGALGSFLYSMHADKYAARLADEEYRSIIGSIRQDLARQDEFVAASRSYTKLLQKKSKARDDARLAGKDDLGGFGWSAADEALLESTRDAWRTHLRKVQPKRGAVKQPTMRERIPGVREPEERPIPEGEFFEMIQLISRTESERVYRDAMKRAGSYVGGGSFEITRLIENRVFEGLSLFKDAIAPALQNAVERSLHEFESGLVARGRRPEGWKPVGLFTENGYAIGNRATSALLLRDLLRESFDDLDETFGPNLEKAQQLPAVKNLRKRLMAEISEEFDLRQQALAQRTTSVRADTDAMRKEIHGEELAILKRKDVDDAPAMNTPIREGESLQQAAQRFADQNGLDLSRFDVEEGFSVKVVPVLVNRTDPKTVIWGQDAVRLLAARDPKLKDYLLAEARIGPKKVESLSNDIVDLSTGELKYDVPPLDADGRAVFRVERGEKPKREPSPNQDPKFRKAMDDLKRLDKRIAELRQQKQRSPEQEAELRQALRSKRNLFKKNPAVQTWIVRGSAKRALTRQIENRLNREVGDIDAEAKLLADERAAKVAEVEAQVQDFARSRVDDRKRSFVEIANADYNRVFTQDEFDEYLSVMIERRSRSVSQWAARRRAVGDMPKQQIEKAVDNALEQEAEKLRSYFKDQGDGTFKMTQRTFRVNALYARHHYKAYEDALAGRHPILQADDVPAEVRRVLSLAATPADRAPGAIQSVERLAATLSGARPYPVWKRFGNEAGPGVVRGRTVTFERSTPNRVGVAAGTRIADEAEEWNRRIRELQSQGWEYRDVDGSFPKNFVDRYEAQQAALKLAAEHAYSRVSLRQGAWVRALQEAQSGPLRELNTLLSNAREFYVFSVLPARVGSVVRNVLDSVAKMLIAGFFDPRYWLIRGVYTVGEQEARAKLKAVSGDFLHASFPTEMRVLNAARSALANQALVTERYEQTLVGKLSKEASEFVSEQITNVFQIGVNELDLAVRLMAGPKYGDAMAARLRHVFNTAFWGRPLAEIRKTLQINGVYKVPDEVIFGVQTILRDGQQKGLMPREQMTLEDWAKLNGVRDDDVADYIRQATENPALLNETRNPVHVMLSHTADVMWDLMVGRPEGRLRRGLYNAAYTRAVRKGADSTEAHVQAMKAIDKTLFDYSKLTTLDENVKHLAPFLFFWRRNIGFWITESIRKPYLPAAVVKFEEMLDNQNEQDPGWSRRYLRLPFLNDALARLPVVNAVLPNGGNFELGLDPMTYLSAAPLYRAFRGENPMLPADRSGIPFLSGLIEGMNDFGLSLSPWARKPLELAGVFDYRAWQTMFPQTALVDAFTQQHLNEMFPNGLNFEETLQDTLFELVGASLNAGELNQRRIDELVQLEIAAQVERGEPVDRAAAEEKVRQFTYVQTVLAFSVGAYLRHLDPAMLNLYRIQGQLVDEEIDFLDLSESEQRAYRIFVRRKLNPGAFNAYLQAVPSIETYDAIEDYDEGQRFLQENPEVIPYVAPHFTGKPLYRGKGLRTAALVADTGAAIASLKAFDSLDFDDPDVRDRVHNVFVTPELTAFWKQNDTPKQRRDKMLRGEVYRYLRDLRSEYFSIPDGDHDSRSAFLRDNPLLAHSFTLNDRESDDLRDVLNYVNNDLREVYFEFVEKKDFDGAADFLKRFPRIFEMTKAANRVTDDGVWLPAAQGSQRAKDYVAALPHLQHYYSLKQRNKQLAYKWLRGNTPGAKLVSRYFRLYADPTKGTRSEHARAYLALKPTLDWFFNSIKDEGEFRGFYSKWGWVFESDDPVAQRLRAYFRKYGDKKGMSAQAKAYVAVKAKMTHYFELKKTDPEAANRWLHSEAGADVLDYFQTYGKTNAAARKWGKWVRSRNPEVNHRLMFWKRYFELEPHLRPGFVHREAEQHGVFIWGLEEERARHEKEQAYVRSAKKRHLTEKQALYLRVKPLLELMGGLDDRDTKILLRLNPDVREYLDKFGRGPQTGDPKLDKKVESYFNLPPDSSERAAFLRSNPEVQDYFDRKNPADAAMHNLLEVYFQIPVGRERNEFRLLHPEISDYFDRKREERSNLRAELQVFDEADPRLDEVRARAEVEIVQAAEVMWARLRGDGAARLAGDDIQVRRERDPERRRSRRSSL